MRGRRASELFFRYALYGVEDRPLGMDCYFWLIRSSGRVWLVDCGWNRERGLGRAGGRFRHVAIEENDPLELLSRLDVPASGVDHIIVSHMHLDHIGNLGLFPNATRQRRPRGIRLLDGTVRRASGDRPLHRAGGRAHDPGS